MRRTMVVTCCLLGLALPAVAQRREPQPTPGATPRPPYQRPVMATRPYQQTWYDILLRQLNPENLDWGQWLEQRRQELLAQSAANPYFKYSLVTTGALLLLSMALAKVWIDKRRAIWLASERYADLLRQESASRREAHKAIRRYNQHMEKCNRVIEAEMAGRPPVTAAVTSPEGQGAATEARLEAADLKRERDALAASLEKNNAIVGELTMRMNTTGVGGNGQASSGTSHADLVRQINGLREQLYRERERNKHLKGM